MVLVPIAGASLRLVGAAFGALALLASCGGGENCVGGGACACDPNDCPDVRISAAENGTTVVMEVGQRISLQLPGPNIAVTARSSEPSVLTPVGKPRLMYGNDGKVGSVYIGFNAAKEGSSRLTFGYQQCDAASVAPCSYQVNVRVVQFPKTTVTVSINYSPPPTVELHVGESARFAGCCEYRVEELKATIDRPDVVHWAVEPFVTHGAIEGAIEGAITAASPGTAHVHGEYCPQRTGSSCPSVWSLTVVVTRS